MDFISSGWLIPVALFGIVAIFSEGLRTFLDIQVTSWTLRRQGVDPKEIHKIAIAKARRQRRNLLLQVLDRLIKLRQK